MTRIFRASESDYAIRVATPPVTGAPLTFSAWIRRASNAGSTRVIMAIRNTASAATRAGYFLLQNSSQQIIASAATPSAISSAATTDTIPLNEWVHVAAVFASTASRTAYLSGVAGAEETTSRVYSSTEYLSLGAQRYSGSSVGFFFDGEIASPAVYNVGLSASEVKALAEGYSPSAVRPQNLVWFPEQDDQRHLIVDRYGFPLDIFGADYSPNSPPQVAARLPRRVARVYAFPSGASSGTTVAVPKASLVLTGHAPTVVSTANVTVSVPKGSLVLTGYSPNVLVPQVVQVPKGGLVLTGYAPDVLTPVTVLVPKGTLTITGYAPTIVVTSNKLIEVPKGALVLRGYAPTVLGTVVAATNRGSYGEPDRRLRERLRRLAIQQAHIEDDEEALAILLASIIRR